MFNRLFLSRQAQEDRMAALPAVTIQFVAWAPRIADTPQLRPGRRGSSHTKAALNKGGLQKIATVKADSVTKNTGSKTVPKKNTAKESRKVSKSAYNPCIDNSASRIDSGKETSEEIALKEGKKVLDKVDDDEEVVEWGEDVWEEVDDSSEPKLEKIQEITQRCIETKNYVKQLSEKESDIAKNRSSIVESNKKLKTSSELEVEVEMEEVMIAREVRDEVTDEVTARARVQLYHDAMAVGYDAETADPTYICAFCGLPPHRRRLGELFGPYWEGAGGTDLWTHLECAVWVPCVQLVAGRVQGIGEAARIAAALRCAGCGGGGASVGCTHHGCRAAAHVHCCAGLGWTLEEEVFLASCPLHSA